MTDLSALVSQLKRPRLLVRAARFGLADYSRSRDLKRILASGALPGPDAALAGLLAEESRLEASRRAGSADYCVMRHIDVLIAVMAEARLLPRRPQQSPEPAHTPVPLRV
ncbi:DUF6477 family protein [Phaeovulum sp. NW3]|uniref:DUF6477 family protein n=1 Tax=Phaeovulum sp. NW3 TaxID=2934933 RepID=UPI002021BE1F|nr:DUF6477 family protein [Phaeovulum sp. NW3]MCL7463964.1 DUF6477 family protein [Phaeovulum sp. NW3]